MISALLGSIFGAFKSWVDILVYVLRESRKFLKVGVMAAGVSVFAALASSLAAFVVYHVVGLVVFLVSPLVTFSAVQIVVAAYTGLFFLAASKFVHRFIPS